jgi:CPA1 family monovalent cation:H+ antiporter
VHNIEAVLGLVVVAIVVAALAGRLRTPAPGLLVLAGLGIGFIPGFDTLHVSPELVTLAVLPPLLFSAAEQVSLIDLRAVWRPVAVLAVGLVLVTAAVVAAVTHAVDTRVTGAVAFTFGAVLASTDPVAVTALSRELRLPARIGTLVQAESLFNDATSLLLFEVAVAAAVQGHLDAEEAARKFVVLAAGGVAVGIAAGLLAAFALRKAHDPTAQAALALVTPYVAAVTAHAVGVSPVTAVIVAGLMLARRRVRSRQPEGRLLATSVYEVVVFVLENAIFAVIGLELAGFIRDLAPRDRGTTVLLLGAVTGTLLASRAAALALPLLVPRTRRAVGASAAAWRVGAVVTWAGARGVIPLAAALSIPTAIDGGAPFPHRSMLLVAATGVVVITLVVQGTTLAPLVRRLGVVTADADRDAELARTTYALAVAALDHLESRADSLDVPSDVVDGVRAELQRTADTSRRRLESDRPAAHTHAAPLRTALLDVQAEELARLRAAGEISAETFRHVQQRLDKEHSRFAD